MNDTNVNVPVLVIADPADSTADLMVAELDRRGVASLRVSLAGEPHPVGLMAQMNTWARRWDGFLQWGAARVDLPGITAVYYLPDPSALAPTGAADCGSDVVCELRAALPDARWLNDPVAVRESQRHARQLSAATASGLAVPYAHVTNLDPALVMCAYPEAAQDIADAGGKVTTTQTRFFQERLDADTAHLTMVGDTAFAIVHPRTGHPDATAPADLIHVPDYIRGHCRTVLDRLELASAAFDFALRDDAWTFLELHTGSTWFARPTLEEPTATAIAAYLAEAAPAPSGILPMSTSP